MKYNLKTKRFLRTSLLIQTFVLLLFHGIAISQNTPAVVEWDFDSPSTIPGFEDDDNWIFTTMQASDGSIIGVGFSDKYDVANNSTTQFRHPAILKYNPGPARTIKWESIPTYNNSSLPYVIANTGSGGFGDVFESQENGVSYIYACGIIRTTVNNVTSGRTPIIAKFYLSTGALVYFKTIDNFDEARFTRMIPVGNSIFIAGESSVNGGTIKATIFKVKASDGTLDSSFDGDGWRTYNAPSPNENAPTYFKDLTSAPSVGSLADGFVAVGSVRLDNPVQAQPSRDAFAIRARLTDGALDWSLVFSESSLGSLYTDLESSTEVPFCTGTGASTTTETGSEEGFSVRRMPDGNFAVVARFDFVELSSGPALPAGSGCYPFNTEQYYDNDVAVIKLNQSTGAPLYAIDAGRSVAIDGWNPMVTKCNEIYICANAYDPNNVEIQASVIRVDDNSGSFSNRWRKDTRGNHWELCAFGITLLEDGGLLICGNNGKNGDDYEMIKFSNPAQANTTFDQSATTITGSVTWNTAKKVKGVITVAAEATLTIENTTIEFANTYLTNDWTTLAAGLGTPTKIVVQPKGKLLLINCTLKGLTTTDCSGPSRDWMWEGITVIGTQDAASSLTYQGFVSMSSNAKIEDAYVGIHAGSTYYNPDGRSTSTGLAGGGIVRSLQPGSSILPHFLNCRRSVWLAPSKNASNTSALFQNTNFLCNQALKDANFNDPEGSGEGVGPAFMVGSWNRDKMAFASCSFRSAGPYAYNLRGTGIETFDAAYSVSGSVFQQLTKGIYATYGLGITDAVQVSNSVFSEVRHGGHIVGGSLHRITGSDFIKIPEKLFNDDCYGLRFEGAGNLTVSDDNSFSSNYTGTYGIIVKDSYSKGSDIFNNTFTDVGFGVQTEQNNTGLQIRCNSYTDNGMAWSINPESITGATGLFSDQGICGAGNRQSGNLFNDPDCPGGQPESHIRSKVDFDYSTRSGAGFNANEIPTCVSSGGSLGIVGIDLCGFSGSNTESCATLCQECPPTADPWKDQVLGNKEIVMLLDSNEIEDALALIELLYPDDPGYYIGALINAGLYNEAEEKLAGWEDNPGKPDPFRSLLVYLLDVYGKGQTFMDMGKEDMETLEALAAEKSPAQYYVQSILSFVTGIEIKRPIEKWEEEPEERASEKNESSLPFAFTNELAIQPNPATEMVTVRWRTDVRNISGSLELWNMEGHLLQRMPITLTAGVEQVYIGLLPPGVYVFSIQGTGASITRKFVIE